MKSQTGGFPFLTKHPNKKTKTKDYQLTASMSFPYSRHSQEKRYSLVQMSSFSYYIHKVYNYNQYFLERDVHILINKKLNYSSGKKCIYIWAII